MAISIYRSTDPSAPVLTGQAGSFITVLDACLVNGYGSKTALGWTKEFSGTNLATYRAATGNRLYLGIDDTGTSWARARGFQSALEAGAAAMAGTFPFPSAGQIALGVCFAKASTTNGTARAWVLVSNGRMLYFYIDFSGTGIGQMWCFGDVSSFKSGDTNCTIIIGADTNNANNNQFPALASPTTIIAGHFMSLGFDGIVHSVAYGKSPVSGACMGTSNMGQSNIAQLLYPDPINGGMILTPIHVHGPDCLRGYLPGIWAPCHPAPMVTGDTISGTTGTDLEGKAFECFKCLRAGGTDSANVLIETSDTWA